MQTKAKEQKQEMDILEQRFDEKWDQMEKNQVN